MADVDHIAGYTWHGRKGAIRNAFRYNVDFVLVNAEADLEPRLTFGRNRFGLFSLRDKDHGGQPGQGRGPGWVRDVLSANDLPQPHRIELLAQPRVIGYVFNPVAFWLCYDEDGALHTVIPEVTNTYGDRHCYLCRRDDGLPISPDDTLTAAKVLHVSPFQRVEGGYRFRFDVRADRVAIWIDFTGGNGGVTATLVGPRRPLRFSGVARSLLRRPFGTRRVMALIHWQALKLWWKGAAFRARPQPPAQEISR
ncbi:MAG: DUF1365 domain-containing protein [Pseudomonadota bacterium]